MSNPVSPSGCSERVSTFWTDACTGPTSQNAATLATAGSAPSRTTSTVPSVQLRAQPETPSRRARWRIESRKNTP